MYTAQAATPLVVHIDLLNRALCQGRVCMDGCPLSVLMLFTQAHRHDRQSGDGGEYDQLFSNLFRFSRLFLRSTSF